MEVPKTDISLQVISAKGNPLAKAAARRELGACKALLPAARCDLQALQLLASLDLLALCEAELSCGGMHASTAACSYTALKPAQLLASLNCASPSCRAGMSHAASCRFRKSLSFWHRQTLLALFDAEHFRGNELCSRMLRVYMQMTAICWLR